MKDKKKNLPLSSKVSTNQLTLKTLKFVVIRHKLIKVLNHTEVLNIKLLVKSVDALEWRIVDLVEVCLVIWSLYFCPISSLASGCSSTRRSHLLLRFSTLLDDREETMDVVWVTLSSM